MKEVSVIIPTYNRRERLRQCLNALAQQTQPAQDYEVIVVVDGSTDGTVEMLRELETPYELKVLIQENCGQTYALHHGISSAKGKICLLIDDDLDPDANLISEHINLHLREENTVGVGYIKLTLPKNADFFTKCYARSWDDHYMELISGKRKPTWNDCFGGNMSASRSVIQSCGGYPTNVKRGHDTEFAFRLYKNGQKFEFLPNATAVQYETKGKIEIISDAEESGRGWVKLWHLYPPMLPTLLGWFGEAKRNEILLRRILLALSIPGVWLLLFSPLFQNPHKKYKWNRFIHIYSYWRGVKRAITEPDTWRRLVARTPILMYHSIGHHGEPASTFILPFHRFKSQMGLLNLLGYRVLSLKEYIEFRIQNRLPPNRSVVLTFDDGYIDNKELAFPVLKKYQFPFTIFLVTGLVGKENVWSDCTELEGRKLLSWENILELQTKGVDFGAHTRTHRLLTTIPMDEVWKEISGSRIDLETHLKSPVGVFAYPYGEYNCQIQTLAKQAGFIACCNTDGRNNTASTNLYALRRTEVFGNKSLLDFLSSLF
jgi:glycosyltransferase involved in cell wall biosynthesis/peptidoglycan/xylan/chitin deacetylase (PgdA/CDA1 family)